MWTRPGSGFVAAALVLPQPLAWVVAVLRWQRWFVARRPAYRYLHSVAVAVHACAAAHVLAAGVLPDATWTTSLPLVAALTLAATAYWLVQAGLVGTAICLLHPPPGRPKPAPAQPSAGATTHLNDQVPTSRCASVRTPGARGWVTPKRVR